MNKDILGRILFLECLLLAFDESLATKFTSFKRFRRINPATDGRRQKRGVTSSVWTGDIYK
jgi:hypothetical protein